MFCAWVMGTFRVLRLWLGSSTFELAFLGFLCSCALRKTPVDTLSECTENIKLSLVGTTSFSQAVFPVGVSAPAKI